ELLLPDRCRGATPGGHRAVRVLSPRGLRPHRCVRRRAGPESGRRAECTPAEAGRADHAHSRSGLPLLRPRLARPGGPHVLSVRLLQATRGVEGRPDHDVAPGRPRPVRRRAGRDGRPRSRLVAGAACRRGPGRRLPRRGPGVRCPGGSTPRRALRRGAAAGVPHTALLVRSGLHHRRAGARYREAATAASRRIGAAVAMTPLLAVASFGYHEVTDHPGTAGFQRPGALRYKHTGEAFTRNWDAIAGAHAPAARSQACGRRTEAGPVGPDEAAQRLGTPRRTGTRPRGARAPLVVSPAGAAGLGYLFRCETALRQESLEQLLILGRVM